MLNELEKPLSRAVPCRVPSSRRQTRLLRSIMTLSKRYNGKLPEGAHSFCVVLKSVWCCIRLCAGGSITCCVKRKGKGHPRRDHEGPQKCRGTAYSFFNLGSKWGEWWKSRLGRFTPGKETRCPLHWSLGGPRAGVDGWGKYLLHRNSIPGPSIP